MLHGKVLSEINGLMQLKITCKYFINNNNNEVFNK